MTKHDGMEKLCKLAGIVYPAAKALRSAKAISILDIVSRKIKP